MRPISRPGPGLAPLVTLCLLALCAQGCSINRMATKAAAGALTKGPDVFSSDDDPQLVEDAIPFGLKTYESLLAALPDDPDLLLACTRGFTQYAVGFVGLAADTLGSDHFDEAQAGRERALRLLLRARNYVLRGLELKHKGLAAALATRPDSAAATIGKEQLPMLYWTAAAWGSAIGYGKDRPELLGDIDAVRALMKRALTLDDTYEGGQLHEAGIVLEALPKEMGGSLDRAKQHFDRAIELSHDKDPAPYVTWAQSVSIPAQDRAEFTRMLNKALSFDPEAVPSKRLLTILMQRKAHALLARADDLFIAPSDAQPQEKP
jgi:tetratricopeptide (TPR) repeat protein